MPPAVCTTSTSASSSARSWPPPARGTTSCGTRWWRATASGRAAGWRPSGAPASRATTRPRPPRRSRSTTSAASLGWRRSASRSWSGSRTSPTSGESARASASTRPRARSSCRRRCRCSRTSDCAGRARRGGGGGGAPPPRRGGGDGDTWVQDFGVLGPGDKPIDLQAHGARVADCISAVWRGDTESDPLNRLVLAAGLDWRQIEILRAYRKYRQRIGSRFTESYQNDTLVENAALTAKLVELFELRFDPEHERDEAAEKAMRKAILAALDKVESLDHDRILRNQLGLIEATLRTNAYRRGRGAMSFKLRSADVPAIPEPAPLVEIYVYSAEMEGIHLRGGRIARGGIRWSDRMDYRTEVYGLMRAQMTKNAQIVPDGAKGGFYLKHRPADPSALRKEVQRQY